MGLEEKTLTEIRELAQSLGVQDIFSKPRNKLEQEINNKQIPIKTQIDYLVVKLTEVSQENPLSVFISRGLKYREEEGRWFMSFGEKTDEGTLTMSEVNLIRCAERLMA